MRSAVSRPMCSHILLDLSCLQARELERFQYQSGSNFKRCEFAKADEKLDKVKLYVAVLNDCELRERILCNCVVSSFEVPRPSSNLEKSKCS
jgi:hypothetical protein